MTMTSHGAICAIMKVSRMPRRPLKRMRAIAKDASSAISSEAATESTVTVNELRTRVQKWSAATAFRKCSKVMSVGNHTGVSVMMSPVGLKAVLNIQ